MARVIYAEGESLAHGLAYNLADQVLAIAHDYSHILLPATAWGKRVGARVAEMLNVASISDVIGILSLKTFEQLNDAGKATATVQSGDAVKVLTVSPNGYDAAGQGGTASIEGVTAVARSATMVETVD